MKDNKTNEQQIVVMEDDTEEEIYGKVYDQWQADSTEKYGPCSCNYHSQNTSTIGGNMVTLRNGSDMLCQYAIRKDGTLAHIRG